MFRAIFFFCYTGCVGLMLREEQKNLSQLNNLFGYRKLFWLNYGKNQGKQSYLAKNPLFPGFHLYVNTSKTFITSFILFSIITRLKTCFKAAFAM